MALPLNAFHTLDTEFNKTITWKQTVNVNGGKIRETFQRGAHVNSIDNHAMGNWNKSFYTVDNSICNCTKKKKTRPLHASFPYPLSYGRKTVFKIR